FLRHIERTRVLLHLIDITDSNPIENYQTIQEELKAYGRGLGERPQIVAFNKMDAVDIDSEEVQALVSQLQTLHQGSIFQISAVAGIGLDSLLQEVWQQLDQLSPSEKYPVEVGQF
ncbi:MAG: GTPase ObgE, partial [Planktothrix sp.]